MERYNFEPKISDNDDCNCTNCNKAMKRKHGITRMHPDGQSLQLYCNKDCHEQHKNKYHATVSKYVRSKKV